jgi:NAD-dependent SIR2 family protein deacetylase
MVKQRGGSLIEIGPYDTDLTDMCDVLLRGKSGDVLPQLLLQIRAIMG